MFAGTHRKYLHKNQRRIRSKTKYYVDEFSGISRTKVRTIPPKCVSCDVLLLLILRCALSMWQTKIFSVLKKRTLYAQYTDAFGIFALLRPIPCGFILCVFGTFSSVLYVCFLILHLFYLVYASLLSFSCTETYCCNSIHFAFIPIKHLHMHINIHIYRGERKKNESRKSGSNKNQCQQQKAATVAAAKPYHSNSTGIGLRNSIVTSQ